MRRINFFTVTGLLLLAAALSLIFYNMYDSRRAEEASAQVLAPMLREMPDERTPAVSAIEDIPAGDTVPDYILDPDRDMPVIEIGETPYIGYIAVPLLGIEMPVASAWSYAELKNAACRYSGSPYLDDMVICAHNYARLFGGLRSLTPGAEVTFTDADGTVFSYAVSDIEILQPYQREAMVTGDWDLTLFTCTVGGRTRLAVRCERQ